MRGCLEKPPEGALEETGGGRGWEKGGGTKGQERRERYRGGEPPSGPGPVLSMRLQALSKCLLSGSN